MEDEYIEEKQKSLVRKSVHVHVQKGNFVVTIKQKYSKEFVVHRQSVVNE